MADRRSPIVVLALLVSTALLTGCGGGTERAADDPRQDEGDVTSDEAPSDAVEAEEVLADDIPVAYTPDGGYGEAMPPPVLAACTEPLVAGAPDLRGLWRVVEVDVAGEPALDHPARQHVERVEQCGDRLVVTGGGVVHDMRCDGTEANGVQDVAAHDLTTPVHVLATYEAGVHTLRPIGVPVEITRRLDGEQMVWSYLGFTARLERTDDTEDAP